MKKSIVALLLALMMLMGTISLAETVYTPGTYTASAFGMIDDVVVTMTFDEGSITAIEAIGDKETPGIGTKALEELPPVILAAQSADVDAIATATVTSDAILKAAAECIAQAKGETAAAAEATYSTEADVIVIGAGSAGLAAAEKAREAGASVIVLEANGRAGGSAIVSAGNIDYIAKERLAALPANDASLDVYLTYTPADFPAEYTKDLEIVQADINAFLADENHTGIYDSVERIMLDHYIKGYGKDLDGNEAYMDYDYIRTAVEKNEEVFLPLEEAGLTYKPGKNIHFVTPMRGGTELIEVQLKIAEEAGAEILYNTRATELVTNEAGKVCGVIATDAQGNEVTFTANNGVVIATGSFSANKEMVVQYQRKGKGISTNTSSSNPETNIGDGIVMAEKLGAELKDMQFVGYIWRGYLDKANSTEATTISNARQLAVNEEGKRYADDSAASIGATIHQTDAISNAVGDKAMYDALEAYQAGFVAELEERGILFMADSIEELAQKAGMDAATLSATIETFNAAVESGNDAEFGRTKFNGAVTEAPFILTKLQNINHLTFGGLVTDLEARVLKADGTAIPGLYAAGDVVSGFEGAAHQTGECLTIVVYYGQVAGTNAALDK